MKDLSLLLNGRKEEQIIMIDNAPKICMQARNTIPIPDFDGDMGDSALLSLLNLLSKLENKDNARVRLQRELGLKSMQSFVPVRE